MAYDIARVSEPEPSISLALNSSFLPSNALALEITNFELPDTEKRFSGAKQNG